MQRGLYSVGAELGTNPQAGKAFASTGEAEVARLEKLLADLEDDVKMPEGFILPGATPASGALDLARAITRRAERRCLTLEHAGGIDNPEIRRWLNRLSLLLFVLARFEEDESGFAARPAKN
jgi:cob(I)alamin adenosyltransferase